MSFTLLTSSSGAIPFIYAIATAVWDWSPTTTVSSFKFGFLIRLRINATLSTNTGCKNNTKDEVDTSSYNEIKCKEDGYTWESVPSIAQLYFDVVDMEGNPIDTATVVITAEATAPYKKELSAKYILNKDTSEVGSLSVKYESKNTYENVIVINV